MLARIARTASRVYWLNPKVRVSSNTGDSLMPVYAPLCTDATSVRTLGQLHRFVEQLP